MRKRSKKRIPQEVQPWKRLRLYDYENPKITILNKRSTRWSIGSAKNWNTSLLNEQNKDIFQSIFKQVWKKNQAMAHRATLFKKLPKKIRQIQLMSKKKRPTRRSYPIAFIQREYLNWKLFKLDKKQAISKPNNFCLLIGKSSTYNRKLYISRQSVRKLMRLNVMIGVKKT